MCLKYYVGHLLTIPSCALQSFLYKVSIIVETEKGGKKKKKKNIELFPEKIVAPKHDMRKLFALLFFSL